MANDKKSPYRPSPIGIARYPWLNKPDVKFNADGLFKVELVLSGEEAQAFKALIDKAAEEAHAEYTAEMTAGDRKKWSLYTLYEVEEDEAGNPTGDIHFHFKQNAVIKLRDGETKPISIGLYDSRDEPTTAQVYGGSTIRVLYKTRLIPMTASKQVGVRLDFLKVQVIKLATRDSGQGGFGSVDGGYVDEGDAPPPSGAGRAPSDSGDY